MYQETAIAKTNNHIFIPPACLIVGSAQEAADYAVRYIQKSVCAQGGCQTCITCSSIAQQHYYQLLWITPQQRYTLETLEPISDAIHLQLEDNTHFFFVLSDADTLSDACANSLLKIVEEPPTGYHFLFLTARPEKLLPTITSRCIITRLEQRDTRFESEPLYGFFTLVSNDNPLLFLKTLEQSKITEQESLQLLDALFIYWNNLYKKNNTPHAAHAPAVLELLKQHAQTPAMAGSAKLFLKNMYLNMHYVMHSKVHVNPLR